MGNEDVKTIAEGAFVSSLKRNFKQIREDRAATIADTAQLKFKRAVEDIEMQLKQMKRDQENMLDLSPDNVQSLILASDFKQHFASTCQGKKMKS